MHLNYYFLRQLSPVLYHRLSGRRLEEAFSQERDEVVFVFGKTTGNEEEAPSFYLKATLRTDFACLSFPDRFDRARRNSVNLFRALYGLRVTGVRCFDNERAFLIAFEDDSHLVFKLFGNRSNVICFDPSDSVTEVFNHRFAADLTLRREDLERHLDQSFEAFERAGGDFRGLFPTLGKMAGQVLSGRLASLPRDLPACWTVVQDFLRTLESPLYYLTRYEEQVTFSLLPVGTVIETFPDPIAALNAFYVAYLRVGNLDKEKVRMIAWLRKRIRQTETYLVRHYDKLADLEEGGRNELYANLLMAHLHEVPEQAESVELISFYTGQPVTIRLKKELTPSKNAEAYYRKAKNEKTEHLKLQENIRAREKELAILEMHLDRVAAMGSLKELRAYVKENRLDPGSSGPDQAADLFRREEWMGYVILVGRNAKNNDLLLRQYAAKDDLWLHARDVSGSHVVIKHQPGKTTPAPVVERAAQLAAWNSKRRHEGLCPVIVTPRKFVRKGKGLADGAVIVEKEEVIMVEPKG